MENPIKMDDLRVPLFLETPIWPNGIICHQPRFPSKIAQKFPFQTTTFGVGFSVGFVRS